MNTTRRSFLTGLLASLAISSQAAKTPTSKKKIHTIESGSLKKKARLITIKKTHQPAPVQPVTNEQKKIKELAKLYAPLCEQVEGNIPFAYQNSDFPTMGCGVLFKDFRALDHLPAIKITPKKALTLNIKHKDGSWKLNKEYLEKIANADWTNPKTLALFPEIEKVEQVNLKDCAGTFPNSNAETWNKELFIMPKSTRDKAKNFAINFHIENAKSIHPNLFSFPPSVCMVIVDLVYNLGKKGYGGSKKFPDFKNALSKLNFEIMKKECTTKNNSRRNAARKFLIESAKLTNKGFSEEKIKQILQNEATFGMYPRQEPLLWHAINEGIKANCAERTKKTLTQNMCLAKKGAKIS